MSPFIQPDADELLREIERLRSRVRELEQGSGVSARQQLLELEYVYAAAPVGLAVLDRDLRYVRINERLAKLNGLPVAAHIGRTVREVIPEKTHILEPIYRAVLETGVEVTGRELTLASPAGDVAHYVCSYYPLRSAGGETIGICGVVQDVTAERTAERELRESESKYRFLTESLPQFVWTADMNGQTEYRNRHLIDYAGMSCEDCARRDWLQAVHPGDSPHASEVMEFARLHRRDFEVEFRIRRASDGEYRWFLCKATPFEAADGCWRWLGIAFDIDDRKRAEQTRTLLASIVESSSDAIVGLDSEGCITSWNPAAKNLFGYTAAEAIGRPYSFLAPHHTEEHVRQTMARVAAGERIERHETIRASKGGDELTVFIEITPIRDEFGRVTGAFKTVRDLTEHRRVERELSVAHERLRLVQRAVKAGIWEVDMRTGVAYRSPELCELYGLEHSEIAGSVDNWAPAVHPDDAERVRNALRDAIHSQRELRLQYRILLNGETRWLTAFGCVVDKACPPRMVGITIDTTEIQKSEETMRRTARLEGIGRLAGGVAHDFNNLLAGILGGATFIEEMLPEGHSARPMLDVVIRSSERAAHLTRQLLAYAGKGSFTLRELDLSKTVQDSFSLLRGSIPDNVELVVQTGWELPLIEADGNQVRETILNLVTNAAEAIGDRPGAVCVRTGIERLDRPSIEKRFGDTSISPGTYVYLEVSDSGEGMTPEVQRRIFEPFFTTKFMGRGLGLSAVEGIVRGHNGTVEVISDPGIGSTFRILLPAAATRREIQSGAAVESGRHCGFVLVIDDEEAVRNIVKAALERAGYRVLLASDGMAGLEMFRLRREHISLVILDVSMPKMAGAEVHGEFEKDGIDIPVLITSGYPESEAMNRISATKLAGFIQKPFNVRDLSALIEKLIGPPNPPPAPVDVS